MTDDVRQQLYWEQDHGHRAYDHPVVNFFARQRIASVGRWLDWPEIKNAVDVGCGNGFSTYYMRHHISDIWGVDRSQRMLFRHPLKKENRLFIADGFHLPFAHNAFDLVYGWEMLHHISDPRPVVAEMARVSRRYVLLAEPNRNNPAQFAFALLDSEHRWVLRYNLKYMCRLLESAQLKVERARRGGWLFPNVTPAWFLPLIKRLPYWSPLGISNWVLASKRNEDEYDCF